MSSTRQGDPRPLGKRRTLHNLRLTSRSPNQAGTSDQTLVPSSESPQAHHAVSRLKKRASAFGINALVKLRIIKSSEAATQAVWSHYELIRHIGSGGNAHVDLCRDIMTGTLVAVKTLVLKNPAAPLAEASILQHLGHHSNIIRYHTSLLNPAHPSRLQLVFEYCPRGDLLDYLDTLDGPVPELFLWHVFKHVACGLAFLHSRGVVHGDIKPANILLTANREGESFSLPKIADFGAVSRNCPRNIPRGHLGTPAFQPPEETYQHGPESDIWALGCMIHEMVLGRLPVQELEEPDIDAIDWFEKSDLQVPDGITIPLLYKEFCFYQAFHAIDRTRIDHASGYTTKVYTKLLNHFMMRALELEAQTLITASQLHNTLPTLEAVVQHLHILGKEELLNCFDERRDIDGEEYVRVTESQVLRQLFENMGQQMHRRDDFAMRRKAMQMLYVMDPMDHVEAFRSIGRMPNFFNV
jgi:serine/threonine protein kinase